MAGGKHDVPFAASSCLWSLHEELPTLGHLRGTFVVPSGATLFRRSRLHVSCAVRRVEAFAIC